MYFVDLRNHAQWPCYSIISNLDKVMRDHLVNFYCATLCYRGICCRRMSVCLSVRPSVRHKPVLCRKDWTNPAGLGMGASFHLPHIVLYVNLGISKKY